MLGVIFSIGQKLLYFYWTKFLCIAIAKNNLHYYQILFCFVFLQVNFHLYRAVK